MSRDRQSVDGPKGPNSAAPKTSEVRDATWDVLSEHINDLIVLADLSGAIFYASPSCRQLGYSQQDLIGRTAVDFVHPEDLQRFTANSEALLTAAAGAEARDREHRIRRKDGSWIWMEGNPSLLPGGGANGPAGVINVFRDVTERRVSRDSLAEHARRADQAEAVAGLGYWRLDAATQKITWSDQVFHIFGLPPGDEPPLDVAMAMSHPGDVEDSQARLNQALADGAGWPDVVTRIVRPDGQIRHLNGRAVCERDAAGEVSAVFGTLIDVTEQYEARVAIEESERRYRLLAENTTDMISQTAVDGQMIYLSPSVERMTGYSIAELMPRKMREFVHPDDLGAFIAFYGALISGKTEGGEPVRYRVLRKDGSWLWLESNPRLVVSTHAGVLDTIIDISRDVTEQQALKAQLRAALAEAQQAVAVKAEFLANMSHEIRTPLTSVLGFTSLLAERTDLDETARGQIARIAGASRALLAIVNDVLDFSKLEAGEVTITPAATAAGQAARDVLEMFELQAAQKGLRLAFVAQDVPARVWVDADRLRQILTNLIGNAVKFTERGSVAARVSYDPTGQRLAVEIADTGPGIAAAAREKLFQRFSQVDGSSTRAKGGTGLGLAISQQLAEAMDGSISLTSRVGAGSTFRLELAAPVAQEAAPSDGGEDDVMPLDGVRVLIVDDNAANRELVRAILEPAGVEVSLACDGEDGVQVARRVPVDLILMDLRMPGLDGRTAAAQIRANVGPNRDMPILAFSADADIAGRAPGAAHLFDGHVGKPVTANQLLEAVRAAVFETAPEEEVSYHVASR